MGLHDEARLDQKFVGFAKLLNTYLNHFPKHEKYGLAQQIRNAAYDMYNLIVEAQKRYAKKTTLTNLDIRHEQVRMLVRLDLLGHARRTASFRHLMRHAQERNHALYRCLPKSLRRVHDLHAAGSRSRR